MDGAGDGADDGAGVGAGEGAGDDVSNAVQEEVASPQSHLSHSGATLRGTRWCCLSRYQVQIF